jgi:hypothetical protein
MEVSGQLYAPAALPPGKVTQKKIIGLFITLVQNFLLVNKMFYEFSPEVKR